jgi:hypothetical protein
MYEGVFRFDDLTKVYDGVQFRVVDGGKQNVSVFCLPIDIFVQWETRQNPLRGSHSQAPTRPFPSGALACMVDYISGATLRNKGKECNL